MRTRTAIKVILLLYCFTVLATLAHAEVEKSLIVGVYTWHFTDGHYEEGVDNHMLGFEYDGWSAAFFRNSYARETLFAGYGWHTDKMYNGNWWIRGNLYAGALAGYGKDAFVHYGVLSPGLYPTGNLGYGKYALELGIMPGFIWWGVRMEF